jgi:hypothetical protein
LNGKSAWGSRSAQIDGATHYPRLAYRSVQIDGATYYPRLAWSRQTTDISTRILPMPPSQ